MGRPQQTISWLNIALSIERHLRSWASDIDADIPVYRRSVPSNVAEQRALCPDKAIFFQLDSGQIDRFQDTFCDVTLCETHVEQNYLPEYNFHSVWIREMERSLQSYLNIGDVNSLHLFPLYDFTAHLSTEAYESFLADGDTTALSFLTDLNPAVIQGTGFIVRSGHAGRIKVTTDENPRKATFTTVWQHWAPDVYCAQRG